jgi:hypothetical protein
MVDTDDTDDGIPEADDAILKDAIRLTDAYECVASLVSNHPELLPQFDEEWSEALRKSREEERKIQHDPETFDKETEEEWHRRKEANLFLRLEIEAKKLVACTRDPETGDVLQLRPDDWIPSGWDDYIPPVFGPITLFPVITKLPVQMGHLFVELCSVYFLCAMNLRLGSRRPLEKQSQLLLFRRRIQSFKI